MRSEMIIKSNHFLHIENNFYVWGALYDYWKIKDTTIFIANFNDFAVVFVVWSSESFRKYDNYSWYFWMAGEIDELASG